VDENHQKMIDDLRDTHGADFDKAYADLQITAHKQTIHLDQAEIDSGLDQQVRQLATDLMPTLQMHLKLAEQLKSGL
jgi:putative membrane protein